MKLPIIALETGDNPLPGISFPIKVDETYPIFSPVFILSWEKTPRCTANEKNSITNFFIDVYICKTLKIENTISFIVWNFSKTSE